MVIESVKDTSGSGSDWGIPFYFIDGTEVSAAELENLSNASKVRFCTQSIEGKCPVDYVIPEDMFDVSDSSVTPSAGHDFMGKVRVYNDNGVFYVGVYISPESIPQEYIMFAAGLVAVLGAFIAIFGLGKKNNWAMGLGALLFLIGFAVFAYNLYMLVIEPPIIF